MQKRKKVEFSKKILTGVSFGTVCIVLFSCLMAWRTSDMSVFTYLIPATFAELATATGFYYSKARAENELKISKGVKKEDTDV